MIAGILGKIGSGKSTKTASIVQKNKRKKAKYYKKLAKSRVARFLSHYSNKFTNFLFSFLFRKNFYDHIYSTDPSIQDTIPITYESLGRFKPQWDSLFILEEAGIGLNSRNFKHLSAEAKRFFALSRHMGADILWISQTADIDKACRSRTSVIFIAKKIGHFTFYHRVKYDITIDNEKHDIVEGYFLVHWVFAILESLWSLRKKLRLAKLPLQYSHFVFRPLWYKYFDSYVDDFDYPDIDPYLLMNQLNNDTSKTYESYKPKPQEPKPPEYKPTEPINDKPTTTEPTFEETFNSFFNT